MITARYVREILKAQPFVPFRLILTTGKTLQIPHPDFAWAAGGRVWVEESSESNGLWEDGRVSAIAPLHIAQIEFERSPSTGEPTESARE